MKAFGAKENEAAKWKKDFIILNPEEVSYVSKKDNKKVEGRRFVGSIVLPDGSPCQVEIFQKKGDNIVRKKSDEKGVITGEVIFLNMSIKVKGGTL